VAENKKDRPMWGSTRRRMYRRCFEAVMEAYHEIQSVFGSAGAIDYAKVIGVSSASESDPLVGFTSGNFLADVYKSTKKHLTPEEFALFKKLALDQFPDFTVPTLEFMRVQEKMGAYWYRAGLYPLNKYFAGWRAPRDK
jgi:hypothetical protein